MAKADAEQNDSPWEDIIKFHSQQASLLSAQYQTIQALIGTQHHTESEGDYCEELVRNFLRRFLPSRFSVDTGFIRGTPVEMDGEQVFASNQLDVIVHDVIEYAPIFRSGEFVIVLPDAVRAVVEVKKTLTSGELSNALSVLGRTSYLHEQWKTRGYPRLFTSFFAFSAVDDMKPTTKALSDTYRNRYSECCKTYLRTNALPDIGVVADEWVLARVDPDNYGNAIKVYVSPIVQAELNLGGQILLAWLTRQLDLAEFKAKVKRFKWPRKVTGTHQFQFGPDLDAQHDVEGEENDAHDVGEAEGNNAPHEGEGDGNNMHQGDEGEGNNVEQ